MDAPIVNRVAQSGIITIDLEEFYPSQEIVEFDMKEQLFQGLILREKDYRGFLKENDWTTYKDKLVAIHCSADAIVPTWAYMLLANRIEQHGGKGYFGQKESVIEKIILDRISELDPSDYHDKMVVIKGCGEKHVPNSAYVEITNLIGSEVKSLMYGEPCSTVPIYKKKRQP